MNGEDSSAGNTDQGLNVTPEVDSTPLQHVLARPPRIALALLLGATVADGWFDWPQLIHWPWRGLGALSMAGGLGLTVWALRLFERDGTTHHPYESPEVFVRRGPYRFSRNPMYLGVTLVMLGVGILAGTPALAFSGVIFAWIIDVNFIPREERALEERFGDQYRDYRFQVRRWL